MFLVHKGITVVHDHLQIFVKAVGNHVKAVRVVQKSDNLPLFAALGGG